jgi:uncharacterized protein YicC (UPF0701 family)
MKSMTGFGRAAVAVGARRVVAEVRSVNHRGLDVKVRSRVLAAAAEVEAIRAVRASCVRGSVQVVIEEEGGAPGAESDDDLGPGRLKALATELEGVRSSLGLGGALDLATLAAFVRLRRDRGVAPAPFEWPDVAPALAEALAGLERTRAGEGAALGSELRRRAANLTDTVGEIRGRLPGSAERARARLIERLTLAAAAFGQQGLDPARLAQEAAILADRLDVTEELARLGAHLDRLRDVLADGPSAAASEGLGRPLEFLLQEVGRELNTLGTKAQDADISALVIAGKAELEKIREQAQNIE